jgi:malonyl-CoA O-methyltransferase
MRARFAQATASYDEAAVLAREVGNRMAERLDYVKIQPACLADIGCATGDGIRELQRRYPQALPLAIDFALPMLAEVQARSGRLERWRGKAPRLINADVCKLPVAANSFGLVWSNLMLHWLDDPLPALRELHRVTETAGLITFSMLGPDTLKEVRRACLDLGIQPPLRRFHDMHDIGDMLVAAGFADPVMDMEMMALTYAGPRGLLRDQRPGAIGAACFATTLRSGSMVACRQRSKSSMAMPGSPRRGRLKMAAPSFVSNRGRPDASLLKFSPASDERLTLFPVSAIHHSPFTRKFSHRQILKRERSMNPARFTPTFPERLSDDFSDSGFAAVSGFSFDKNICRRLAHRTA